MEMVNGHFNPTFSSLFIPENCKSNRQSTSRLETIWWKLKNKNIQLAPPPLPLFTPTSPITGFNQFDLSSQELVLTSLISPLKNWKLTETVICMRFKKHALENIEIVPIHENVFKLLNSWFWDIF